GNVANRPELGVQEMQRPVGQPDFIKPGRQFAHDSAPEHHRALWDEIPLEEIFEGPRLSLGGWPVAPAWPAAVLVEHLDVGEALRVVGSCIEEGGLAAQFGGHGPVVVAFQDRDVLAAARRPRIDEVPVHAQIAFAGQHPNALGMTVRIATNDRGSAVRRTVLTDHDLPVETNLLRQHAFESLADEALVVVGQHEHADLHVGPGVTRSRPVIARPWRTATPRRSATRRTPALSRAVPVGSVIVRSTSLSVSAR